MSIKFIDRKAEADRRRHETISFRCTIEQAEMIRALAAKYHTTVTDIILQLFENLNNGEGKI